MIETQIDVGTGELEEVKRRLGIFDSKAPSVLANAINRTVTNIKKSMAQQASKGYNITSGEVKKTIKVSKATRSKLQGATISKASPIALSKFKVSPNRPVSHSGSGKPSPKLYKVSVEKGSANKALDVNPKAFIAIMQSGHHGLMRRISGNSYPIKQLYGPSVPQMIKNEKIMAGIQEEARSTLHKRIDAEIENILLRGGN